MSVRRLLSVAYALLVEGMDADGRERFDRFLASPLPGEETEAQRRLRERGEKAKENAKSMARLAGLGMPAPMKPPLPKAV